MDTTQVVSQDAANPLINSDIIALDSKNSSLKKEWIKVMRHILSAKMRTNISHAFSSMVLAYIDEHIMKYPDQNIFNSDEYHTYSSINAKGGRKIKKRHIFSYSSIQKTFECIILGAIADMALIILPEPPVPKHIVLELIRAQPQKPSSSAYSIINLMLTINNSFGDTIDDITINMSRKYPLTDISMLLTQRASHLTTTTRDWVICEIMKYLNICAIHIAFTRLSGSTLTITSNYICSMLYHPHCANYMEMKCLMAHVQRYTIDYDRYTAAVKLIPKIKKNTVEKPEDKLIEAPPPISAEDIKKCEEDVQIASKMLFDGIYEYI
jgi:hypothetical protein